jgi:aspartyl-tRNA synthetase
MDRYGTDKPDLRCGLPIADVTEAAGRGGFSVFNKAVAAGGVVRAITVPGGASFTRAHIDALTEKALGYGAKGMAWILIRPDGSVNSILTKYFSPEAFGDFLGELQAGPGDFVLFSADTLAVARRALGGLRLDVADLLGLRAKGELRFLFVTDFPQFEYSEAEKRYVATHHPFTMPYPEDLPLLQTAPEKVRAQAYDVVLNGMELGSGSVRIHNRDVQRAMFQALGFSPEEVEERFGFMVNAFRFGAPPHAGFAFGLDRLVMILAGAESLREVIAFPKNRDAACPMTDAPTPVDPAQLRALGLAAGGPARPAPEAPRLDLENIAHLARLYLAPEEQAAYARDMAAMIEFAGQLSHVDTGGAEAAGYGMPLKNIFRPDTPGPSFPREALLANAPTHKGGYITVPKVVES